jgi:hypothetical protein
VKQLNSFRGEGTTSGETAVRQILKTRDIVDDLTYQFRMQGVDQNINSIPRLMAQINESVEGTTAKHFARSSPTAVEALQKIDSNYKAVKELVTPLEKAALAAEKQGNNVPFENFVAKLASKPGKNVDLKSSYDLIPELARTYNLKGLGESVSALQSRIRANQAAVAFNPVIAKNVVGQGTMTAAVGSALMGNPTMLGYAGAGAAATSPRVAYGTALTAKVLWQGKDFLAKQIVNGSNRLVQNPAALNAFVQTINQSTDLAQQTEDQLLSPLQQGGANGQQ